MIESTVKSAKYHINKFLSASASVPQFSDNFAETTAQLPHSLSGAHIIFKESSFLLIITTYFHNHISVSEFFYPITVRYQFVQSYICKEYAKKTLTILGTFPILQSNHLYQLWISKEHIILDCITSHNHKKISKITSQISMARAMSMFFPGQ